MPVGMKLTATYTPDNIIQFPDPDGGAWGDALGAYLGPGGPNTGWIGDVLSYDTDAMATVLGAITVSASNVDYVNTSDALSPAIRVVLVFSDAPTTFDMGVLQTAFESALNNSGAESNLADFDSLGALTYQSYYAELWSDVVTI